MHRLHSFFFLLLFISTFLLLPSCKSGKKSSSAKINKTHKESSFHSRETNKALSTARSYIGTPYKYGGTTRSGMDCSGLVYTCYKTANVTLPRTSSQQSTMGKKVDLTTIREGDLLFFTDRKGHKKVTHVGMVSHIKNRNEIYFIHASTKLGVVESNLFAPYYISIFLFAKRVI